MDMTDWGKIMFLKLIVSYWKVNVIHSNILPCYILFITTFTSCDLSGDSLMVAE